MKGPQKSESISPQKSEYINPQIFMSAHKNPGPTMRPILLILHYSYRSTRSLIGQMLLFISPVKAWIRKHYNIKAINNIFSCVAIEINHLGYWENTQKVENLSPPARDFLRLFCVLPTSRVVYFPRNSRVSVAIFKTRKQTR